MREVEEVEVSQRMDQRIPNIIPELEKKGVDESDG
jgi:hypothetical protein